jgi:hypothetical protein
MGILVEVRPEDSFEISHFNAEDAEDVVLLQTSVTDVVGPQADLKLAEQLEPSCSIMDKLLEAVNAANNAIDNQLPLPHGPASYE